VHAQLANITGDRDLSWSLYLDALTSDYNDIQGGTTAEGIHAGVMAGTVWVAIASYAGLDLHGEVPEFRPRLPKHWRKISFEFTFRGVEYECEITPEAIRIEADNEETCFVRVDGDDYALEPDLWTTIII
jgi:trehalose/maltose hydrolase-like predicted phosphorylase